MKNLIGKELIDFEVQAYHEGDFKTVTKENGACSSFTRQILPLYARQSWRT